MTHLHEKESYKTKLVQWEKEQMEYKFISKNTRLYKSKDISDLLQLVEFQHNFGVQLINYFL